MLGQNRGIYSRLHSTQLVVVLGPFLSLNGGEVIDLKPKGDAPKQVWTCSFSSHLPPITKPGGRKKKAWKRAKQKEGERESVGLGGRSMEEGDGGQEGLRRTPNQFYNQI